MSKGTRKKQLNLRRQMISVMSMLVKKHNLTHGLPEVNLRSLEEFIGIEAPRRGEPYSKSKYRMAKVLDKLCPGWNVYKIKLATPHKQPMKQKQFSTGEFYKSYQWRKLRYQVLKKYGKVCMSCGKADGPMHVDHIKPLRKYWHLRLEESNLQVLCPVCNHGKGNWDETDWRTEQSNTHDDIVMTVLGN